MEKQEGIQLKLSREQVWKFYVQIFTYLYCRTLPLEDRPTKEFIEELTGIGGRLFSLVRKADETASFALDTGEAQALRNMCHWLMVCYKKTDSSLSNMAIRDLEECRELLEKAEQEGQA